MSEKYKELEKLAAPLVEYLRENFHPHCVIVVTDTSAKLVEEVMGVPFEARD